MRRYAEESEQRRREVIGEILRRHQTLFQLLQAARRAHLRRHRRVRKAGLPVGDADLADIDVAFGIQRDAVRREEFADLDARAVLAAEPRDAFALRVDDGQPRAEIGRLAG